LVGYDHCGRPVYNWVSLGHSCHRHCDDRGSEIRIGSFRFRF
jgi:hypothetical protein